MLEGEEQHVCQVRQRGDKSWYSPSRDINFVFPALVRASLASWRDNKTLEKWLAERELTIDDVAQVGGCLAQFVSEPACLQDAQSHEEALTAAGFDELSSDARVAGLYLLGETMLAVFWRTIRMALRKDGPLDQYDVSQIIKAAAELRTYVQEDQEDEECPSS